MDITVTHFITDQIRYKRQADNQAKKELQTYDIMWECPTKSEKTNKTISIFGWILLLSPILLVGIWWNMVLQSNDLGIFFGGFGLPLLIVPMLIIGLILTIYAFMVKSKCRKKYPKYTPQTPNIS